MGRRNGTGMVLAGGLVLLAVAVGLWSAAGREARTQGQGSATARVDGAAHGAAALFRSTGRMTPAGSPQPVAISREAVRRAMRSGTLPVVLPDGTRYTVAMAREETSPGGHWTVIGHVTTTIGRQAMVLTFGPDAVFGVLPRPDGFQFQLATTRGVTTLAPAGGIRPPTPGVAGADFVVPPRPAGGVPTSAGAQAVAVTAAADAIPAASTPVPVEIDVLALYTADHAALRGSDAAAETEVTNLFATANQAYLESGTGVTLRVRQIARVVVGETLSNHRVLDDITYNRVAGFDIHALRDSLSADLVALVRPYRDDHGSCGVAWLNGGGLAPGWTGEAWGYSVTNIAPCGPHVLAHEVGHNLGSAHDRTTMTSDGQVEYGAYPFSFGFRQDGPPAFGTVMAYVVNGQRWIGLFSDPASSACGAACGIPEHADNVRSLRLMAPRIARFRNAPGSLAIDDAAFLEGEGEDAIAWLRIQLSGPAPAGGVRFDVETVDGSALAGVDFVATRTTGVEIVAGERTTMVPVPLLGDDAVEGDETFAVRLSNVVGATVFDGEAVATVVNDDPRLAVTGRVVFPTGMAPPAQTFHVHATVADGHGGSSQTVAVGPPDYGYRFAVPRGSQVRLSAFPPPPFVSGEAALGWVTTDLSRDLEVQRGVAFSGRMHAAEGQAPPATPVSVRVRTSLNGQPSGEWSFEAVPPDFAFGILAAPGAWLVVDVEPPAPWLPQHAKVHRMATDTGFDFTLDATRPSLYVWGFLELYEGSGNVLQRSSELVVQLSAPAPPGGVSLDYASVDGTATAGSDYTALAGTLVFAEGERDKRIPLEWMGDDVLEHVETFTVRVSNVVGAIPTTPEVTFDIVDDDARTGGNLRPDGAP